jgi:hypothetical protein
MSAIRDPWSHDDLPLGHRDRRAAPREAVFSRAIEQRLQRLGRGEVLATAPLGGPGHESGW